MAFYTYIHSHTRALQNVFELSYLLLTVTWVQSGDGIKCVCDSAAAGDEEREGMDPNVKPACTCTGGKMTQFSNTEEGGPLDTGGHGAWPQELPRNTEGAAYVDGIVGNNAYKARTQLLAAVGEEEAVEDKKSLAAWNALLGLAEKAVGKKGKLRTRVALEEGDGDEEEGDNDDDDVEDELPRWRVLHEDPKATAADRCV